MTRASSDRMTFHCFRVQSSYSLANSSLFFWLASQISGFLPIFPNPLSSLHIVHVEMLLLSLLNIALSSAVVFLPTDFTKHLSDRRTRSIRICRSDSGGRKRGKQKASFIFKAERLQKKQREPDRKKLDEAKRPRSKSTEKFKSSIETRNQNPKHTVGELETGDAQIDRQPIAIGR